MVHGRPKTPEQEARKTIDKMLDLSGWDVQDVNNANIYAKKGVAIGEFPLNPGHGFADYLLYVDGKATGVIEAKKAGNTLTGVEIQSDKTEIQEKTPMKGSPKSSPKTELKIIELMMDEPEISAATIGEILEISRRAVLKHTKKLQEKGMLKRIGPARGGHWEVKIKEND